MSYATDDQVSLYSDCHKSEHGFRPSLQGITQEVIDEYFEGYDERIAIAFEEERIYALEAQKQLEQTIAAAQEVGAGDRSTALRWLFGESEDLDHDLWEHGLDYQWSSVYRQEVKRVLEGAA